VAADTYQPRNPYIWHIDVKPEKREAFRKAFRDLSRFNKGLPAGCKFEAVYETVIGRRSDEPPFQVWFLLPDLATFEAAAVTAAVRKFHDELAEYLDPSFRPCNMIVKKLE